MSDLPSPDELASARGEGSDWYLGDGEAEHAAHPRSFFIPSRGERESLTIGRDARLLFHLRDRQEGQPSAERMWLEVIGHHEGAYVGYLKNQPYAIRDLSVGSLVRFAPEHIIAVDDPRWIPYEDKLAFAPRRLIEDDSLEPGYAYHDSSDLDRPPRPDGMRTSGWQLLVGDESEAELEDASNVLMPNLAWLMERYPVFGDLVFSGAAEGEWSLQSGRYQRLPPS